MINKEVTLIWIFFIFIYCQGQAFQNMKEDNEQELYPYLGRNNLYGYADKDGNVIMKPQYDEVDFFYNGIAVVRKKGEKEILINKKNEVIPIPQEYDELYLYPTFDQVFIEVKKYTTNRLRFWQWEFLPGFHIIGGGSSDNRLFDTEVLREERTLYWWDGQQKIKSKKGNQGDMNLYFFLQNLGDNFVQVDDAIFKLDKKKIKRVADNVIPYKFVDGGYLIQKRNKEYRLITREGEIASTSRYTLLDEIDLKVGNVDLTLKEDLIINDASNKAEFYKDETGALFIYPDFNKEFPQNIQEYALSDTIQAQEILNKAQNITSVPATDRFILVLDFGRSIFMMDTKGNWHAPEENYGDFKVVTPSRTSIIWPPSGHFIKNPSLPEGWEVQSIHYLEYINGLLKVTIKKEKEQLIGIWDENTGIWLMNPEYHAVNSWINQPPFVAFQKVKDGKWGFYDLKNKRVHIPEIYSYIGSGGWVNDKEDFRKLFLIDIEEKKEFRQK